MTRQRRSAGASAVMTDDVDAGEDSPELQAAIDEACGRRSPDEVRVSLQAIEAQLNDTFVQRQDAIRVILLGVVACQNYILIGPPGTAKTSVIDCFVRHVDTKNHFKILMGRFTQPEHVFGVLDIQAFKAGRYETVTAGMMTEAPLPILDETLKTSDGCMNSLLGALGPEREFQARRTRNICVGGATNWPEVEALSPHVQALYDRFLLRCSVLPVDRNDRDKRRELYRAAFKVQAYQPTEQVSLADLQVAAQAAASQVKISDQVLDLLDSLVGKLVAPGKDTTGKLIPSDLDVSDRRATQLQSVLKANAWLDGRTEVGVEDFEILRHGLWSRRKHIEKVAAVLDMLDQDEVRRLQKRIDEGRSAYRALQQASFPAAQTSKVVEEIKAIAAEVKTALAIPVFTKRGRDIVRESMKALKGDYEQIVAKAKKLAGAGQTP